MKFLDPEEEELVKRIKTIQAQRAKLNSARRKQNVGEDVGMLSSFMETKLLKSELILHEAARQNNANVVQRLILSRVNVNCTNHMDRTPLQWASANGGLDSVKLLLESGADMETGDKYGMVPLLWAAWFGHVHVLKFLIACGANTEVKNKQGAGILHCAALQNHTEIIDFIFSNMTDFDTQSGDSHKRTALHLASKTGNIEALTKLTENLRKLNLKDKNGQSSVHLAAIGGHIGCFEKLILSGANIDDRDDKGMTCLHLAAEQGHSEIAEFLLDFDPETMVEEGEEEEEEGVDTLSDVDQMSKTNEAALSSTKTVGESKSGEGSVVAEEKPEERTEKKKWTWGKLQTVVKKEETEQQVDRGKSEEGSVVSERKQGGQAETNKRFWGKLQTIVKKEDTDHANDESKSAEESVVAEEEQKEQIQTKRSIWGKLLSKKKENDLVQPAKTKEEEKKPDLFAAVNKALAKAEGERAEVGPKPDLKPFSLKDEPYDREKLMTALHICASHGHAQFCRVLLQYGCDPNVQNAQGHTPLHIASMAGQRSIIADLVAYGGDIDVANYRGMTPLHTAVERGNANSVEELLIHGADTNLEERSGQTALYMAARGSFLEIADMIIKSDLNSDKVLDYRNMNETPSTRSWNRLNDYDDIPEARTFRQDRLSGTHVYRDIRHPHADILKPILFRLSHDKMQHNDWKKLARYWKFQDHHIKAIQHQDSGEHSYKEYGYRVLMIWLHGVEPTANPVKEVFEALVKIGRKQMADNLRKKVQAECEGRTKKINCVLM